MDLKRIKYTVKDIIEALVPIEDATDDDDDDLEDDRFADSFRLALIAAKNLQAQNAHANINVHWDENGQPIVTVTVTEMERQVDDT